MTSAHSMLCFYYQQLISVEFQHQNREEKVALRQYMEDQDYFLVTEITVGRSANDFIFIKKSLTQMLEGVDIEEAKKIPTWVLNFIGKKEYRELH